MNTSMAYRQGQQARRSDDPEPKCPYEPGTDEYKAFCDGFVEKIDQVDVDIYFQEELFK